MGLLLAPIPLLYRWLAIGALVLAFGAFCGFKGYAIADVKLQSEKAAALHEGSRIAVARAVVTERIVTKYLPAIERQHVVTETVVKEVPIYVPTTDPDLSAGFRVLHDAAAAGRVPDPADTLHAAAVPAQVAAATITENYGICRENFLMLQGLQDWVAQQQQVK